MNKLTLIEAVIIHVSIDVNVLSRCEGQLNLRVIIRTIIRIVAAFRNKNRPTFKVCNLFDACGSLVNGESRNH